MRGPTPKPRPRASGWHVVITNADKPRASLRGPVTKARARSYLYDDPGIPDGELITHTDWVWEHAVTRPCHTCGAQRGDRCVTDTGRTPAAPHRARKR